MAQVESGAIHLRIILLPNFNHFATMGFIDPFRVANYLEGRPVFRWEFVSENGGLCSSSNGASIMTQSVESVQGILPQIVIVSASWTPEVHATQRLLYMLRDWARRGVTMGGLDTGAFVLAQAGLLKGRSATVHYEHIDSFRELYPTTEVTESLYVFDEGRITCCGGAAAVDFGLQVLVGTHGAALANAAARYIFHSEMRGRGTRQQPERVEPLGRRGAVNHQIDHPDDGGSSGRSTNDSTGLPVRRPVAAASWPAIRAAYQENSNALLPRHPAGSRARSGDANGDGDV